MANSHQTLSTKNPMGWPKELLPLFERALTVEYASLTRDGAPVTYPLTPYVGDDATTLDVSTGLTYPAKAGRARRNPKVALLYSDAVGSGLEEAPVALVQGSPTPSFVSGSSPSRAAPDSSMPSMPGCGIGTTKRWRP